MLFGKNEETNKQIQPYDCYIGVEDTIRLKDSTDLDVLGKIHGKVIAGYAMYISNPGDDDDVISLTTVKGIEVNNTFVPSATDTYVGLRIERGSELNIKTGSVLFTRNVSTKDVHDAYIYALGDAYISFRQMQLTDDDYAKMSLTDLAELRSLYSWFIETKKAQETDAIREANKRILDTISRYMCERILSSKELYVVMHKMTGEPLMMSQVVKNQAGYVTTPPDIMLITKAYYNVMKERYNPELHELVKIENGPDGKGIYNFLGSTFYGNGACGVRVIFDQFAIDASMLVQKPDYSNIPAIQVPVTNPDVERWLLLIGQLGEAKTDDEKLIQTIFYGHLFRALADAKLIIPMKMQGKMNPTDAEGRTVLKEGTSMQLATMQGKGGRPAVHMFTDWKRLRMSFKEEDGWSGLIQPIQGMITSFDCAINATEFSVAGCYIDQNTYENDIRKFEINKQ